MERQQMAVTLLQTLLAGHYCGRKTMATNGNWVKYWMCLKGKICIQEIVVGVGEVFFLGKLNSELNKLNEELIKLNEIVTKLNETHRNFLKTPIHHLIFHRKQLSQLNLIKSFCFLKKTPANFRYLLLTQKNKNTTRKKYSAGRKNGTKT